MHHLVAPGANHEQGAGRASGVDLGHEPDQHVLPLQGRLQFRPELPQIPPEREQHGLQGGAADALPAPAGQAPRADIRPARHLVNPDQRFGDIGYPYYTVNIIGDPDPPPPGPPLSEELALANLYSPAERGRQAIWNLPDTRPGTLGYRLTNMAGASLKNMPEKTARLFVDAWSTGNFGKLLEAVNAIAPKPSRQAQARFRDDDSDDDNLIDEAAERVEAAALPSRAISRAALPTRARRMLGALDSGAVTTVNNCLKGSKARSLGDRDVEVLVGLHPPAQHGVDIVDPADRKPFYREANSPPALKAVIHNCIARMNRKSAPGPDGVTWRHLNFIWTKCTDEMIILVQRYLKGELNPQSVEIINMGTVKGISKKNSSTPRPIAIPNLIFKLLASVNVYFLFNSSLVGKDFIQQFGSDKDGCVKAAVRVAVQLSHLALGVRGPCVAMSLDLSNAFNSVSRAHVLRALAAYPEAFTAAAPFLIQRAPLFIPHANDQVFVIRSDTGVRQGDPMAMVLFALTTLRTTMTARYRFPDVTISEYADDISLVGPPRRVASCAATLAVNLKALGLKINAAKTELMVVPAGEQRAAMALLNEDVGRPGHVPVTADNLRSGSIRILGVPIIHPSLSLEQRRAESAWLFIQWIEENFGLLGEGLDVLMKANSGGTIPFIVSSLQAKFIFLARAQISVMGGDTFPALAEFLVHNLVMRHLELSTGAPMGWTDQRIEELVRAPLQAVIGRVSGRRGRGDTEKNRTHLKFLLAMLGFWLDEHGVLVPCGTRGCSLYGGSDTSLWKRMSELLRRPIHAGGFGMFSVEYASTAAATAFMEATYAFARGEHDMVNDFILRAKLEDANADPPPRRPLPESQEAVADPAQQEQDGRDLGPAETEVRGDMREHLALRPRSRDTRTSTSPYSRLQLLGVCEESPGGAVNMDQRDHLDWCEATAPSKLFAKEWTLRDEWADMRAEEEPPPLVADPVVSDWPQEDPEWDRLRCGIFAAHAVKTMWQLHKRAARNDARRAVLKSRHARATDRLLGRGMALSEAAFNSARKKINSFVGTRRALAHSPFPVEDPNHFAMSLLHCTTLLPIRRISLLPQAHIAGIESAPDVKKIGMGTSTKWQCEASKARNVAVRLEEVLNIVDKGLRTGAATGSKLRDAIGFEMANFLSRAGAGTSRWFQWVPTQKAARLTWQEMREAFLYRCDYSSAVVFLERARYYGMDAVGPVVHRCAKKEVELTSPWQLTQHGLRCTVKGNCIAAWHNLIRDQIHYAAKAASFTSAREHDLRVPVANRNGRAFIVDVKLEAPNSQARFVDVATVGEGCKSYIELGWCRRGAVAQKRQDRKTASYGPANINPGDLYAFIVESSGLLSTEAMDCLGWVRQNGFQEGEVVAPRRWMFDTLNNISAANAKGLAMQHIRFAKLMGPPFYGSLRRHLRGARRDPLPRGVPARGEEAILQARQDPPRDIHAFSVDGSLPQFIEELSRFCGRRFLEEAGWGIARGRARAAELEEDAEAQDEGRPRPQGARPGHESESSDEEGDSDGGEGAQAAVVGEGIARVPAAANNAVVGAPRAAERAVVPAAGVAAAADEVVNAAANVAVARAPRAVAMVPVPVAVAAAVPGAARNRGVLGGPGNEAGAADEAVPGVVGLRRAAGRGGDGVASTLSDRVDVTSPSGDEGGEESPPRGPALASGSEGSEGATPWGGPQGSDGEWEPHSHLLDSDEVSESEADSDEDYDGSPGKAMNAIVPGSHGIRRSQFRSPIWLRSRSRAREEAQGGARASRASSSSLALAGIPVAVVGARAPWARSVGGRERHPWRELSRRRRRQGRRGDEDVDGESESEASASPPDHTGLPVGGGGYVGGVMGLASSSVGRSPRARKRPEPDDDDDFESDKEVSLRWHR